MLKKAAKKFVNLFGVSLVNSDYLSEISKENKESRNLKKNELIKQVFTILQKAKFSPIHIIDIGANRGSWTREVMNYSPNSYFTLIEPQAWLKDFSLDLLENKKVNFLPYGVGEIAGEFPFTILEREDSCTFSYSKEESIEKRLKQIPIQIKTLNQIVQESNFPNPDLIKIDAEGLDLPVLRGANEILGNVEIIFIEAGIGNRKYENSIFQVMNYMDSIGFTLFDLSDLNRPFENKVLWLMELVFIKKNGKIDTWLNYQQSLL